MLHDTGRNPHSEAKSIANNKSLIPYMKCISTLTTHSNAKITVFIRRFQNGRSNKYYVNILLVIKK